MIFLSLLYFEFLKVKIPFPNLNILQAEIKKIRRGPNVIPNSKSVKAQATKQFTCSRASIAPLVQFRIHSSGGLGTGPRLAGATGRLHDTVTVSDLLADTGGSRARADERCNSINNYSLENQSKAASLQRERERGKKERNKNNLKLPSGLSKFNKSTSSPN